MIGVSDGAPRVKRPTIVNAILDEKVYQGYVPGIRHARRRYRRTESRNLSVSKLCGFCLAFELQEDEARGGTCSICIEGV